jgi:hypothetical protein
VQDFDGFMCRLGFPISPATNCSSRALSREEVVSSQVGRSLKKLPHRALGERTANKFACQAAASRDLTG